MRTIVGLSRLSDEKIDSILDRERDYLDRNQDLSGKSV